LTWRLLLAFGAVPAMAVFWMRRRMSETPRELLASGQHDEFRTTGQSLLGRAQAQRASADARPLRRATFAEGFARLVARRDLLVRLIGASAAWFPMDFAYYGNTVSSPRVLAAIQPNECLIGHVVTQLIVFVVAALPGYFIAAWYMDRLGRKAIQNIGFLMMAISSASWRSCRTSRSWSCCSSWFTASATSSRSSDPNSTAFVYPAELLPVEARTTGHGIASAAGKVGGSWVSSCSRSS
jgi:MFS transporter, PHS family, inorganic phosphate transporter